MFKFLKRIRRDGFVCGFGWGPHSHDQAKKDISIPNNQPPSESSAPDTGCIAKEILKHLASPWEWEIKSNGIYECVHYHFGAKEYTLWFQKYPTWDNRNSFYVNLDGFETFEFNQDEKLALGLALINLIQLKAKAVKEEKSAAEGRKLAELFPSCYDRFRFYRTTDNPRQGIKDKTVSV